MCLGVPGKVIAIHEKEGMRMGTVDFGGVQREACLEYVPETQIGDYVIIHVGFAISLIGEQEAQETLALIRQIADLESEIGPESGVA
jgi:hydrogenase expression/formation protein HypC